LSSSFHQDMDSQSHYDSMKDEARLTYF